MPLPTQTPAQFVSSIQNGITALTTRVKNFSPPSAIGAVINAVASQLVFLQSQAQYLIAVSRAATSTGADLTSFVADYYLTPSRLPASFATSTYTQIGLPTGGNSLTFGKFQAPASNQLIPIGTVVQNKPINSTNAAQFQVIPDLLNPNYSAAAGGYNILAGQTTVLVSVQAVIAGTASNLVAGSLVTIVTPNVPADFVLQTQDITNAADIETDAALRVRFANYVSSLAKATGNAVKAAAATQAGLSFVLNDRLDQFGNVAPAFFTLVVDDGSGAINPTTLANISSAVNLVRAEGISYTAIAPANVNISIVVSGTIVNPTYSPTVVRAAIQTALVNFVNSVGVGAVGYGTPTPPTGIANLLTYASIVAIVQSFQGTGTAQGLLSYGSITVNGAKNDVPITNYQLPRSRTSLVTVS